VVVAVALEVVVASSTQHCCVLRLGVGGGGRTTQNAKHMHMHMPLYHAVGAYHTLYTHYALRTRSYQLPPNFVDSIAYYLLLGGGSW
jgi:hypothetical protein